MRALGAREALRYHNGYRTWKVSYGELYQRIGRFSRHLSERGLGKGDRVLLWGENRPEWVYVFWACLARGIEVVPLDHRFSAQLAARIQQEVGAGLLVAGDEVDAGNLNVERMPFATVAALLADGPASVENVELAAIGTDDVVEIVYTSGTTGDPKGVVHRHRNIASNLTAIQREIERFRGLARPFQPLRLLDLLPLSHMFGQSTGLFVPPMLEGAVVFTSDLGPGALLETCRRERVSVLIGVPRLLENLRHEIARGMDGGPRRPRLPGLAGGLESWLRYRRIHRRLGWKFWAFVVGGASLGSELEDFWRWLGYVVVQGYGLTEASPVIAVNHPFHARRGSIGTALAGQQIQLAPDGEILVRGPSVVNEYFARPGSATDPAERAPANGNPAGESVRSPSTGPLPQDPADGWLHTGDIAEMDAEGRLYFRGRKKEMIVRPDGLNVYPNDVETVLNRLPEIQDSVVVGLERNGEERIHAALIPRERAVDAARQRDQARELETAVHEANRQLEAHQRIQGWTLWPDEDFPRTASTMKVRRAEVARRLAEGPHEAQPHRSGQAAGIDAMLAEITGRASGTPPDDARLEQDLGLSSLERVELLAQIESHYQVEIEEQQFAAIETLGELRRLLRQDEPGAVSSGSGKTPESSPSRALQAARPRGQQLAADLPSGAAGAHASAPEGFPHLPETAAPRFLTQPRWTRSLPVALARSALLDLAILPMVRELVRLKVEGLDQLDRAGPPLIFAANHSSHFDTAVLAAALPRRWRRSLAPAMSQDFFRPLFDRRHFPPEQFWSAAGQFLLACGLFNAYPLPQKMSGARRALRYTGELIDRGYCPLVFPEGERTATGRMLPFKSGIGLMARRLGVPVVPVYLRGVFEVYSIHDEWPKPGRVTVRFGSPLRFDAAGGYLDAAQAVERAVRELESQR